MNHRRTFTGVALTFALSLTLALAAGCSPEEKPLPTVEGVAVEPGSESTVEGAIEKSVVVSWKPSSDSRVEGYAIYRAEQGLGVAETEKSEFTMQAITVVTHYIDDEVRASLRYPTMRYFYQVAVISAGTVTGPMSPEVSIEYTENAG
jgi:hypothetical protein